MDENESRGFIKENVINENMASSPLPPPSPSPPSPKPSSKKVLLLIVGLVVVFVLSGMIAYWYVKREPKEQIQPVSKPLVINNFFTLPGWKNHFEYINTGMDGSSLTIKPFDEETNWTRVSNDDCFEVKGDFELLFKVFLDKEEPASGSVAARFYLLNRPAGENPETLRFSWEKEPLRIFLRAFTADNERHVVGGEKMPASGRLGIRFTNTGVPNEEKVTVFDQDTGEVLFENQLPFLFFPQGNQLSFQFEVGGGLKSFSLEDFEIKAPNSENLVKLK